MRADIQALRGIAILLVVAYHFGVPFLDGGFVGVDVFFVLSGFLITKLLVDEQERTGRINLWEFYARRVRRLLPAATIVTFVTVCTAHFILSPLEQRRFVGSAIAASLYISNVLFARDTEDYLASPPEENPFLHTWSLSVEEQFYAFWPLLLLIAGYRARTRATRLAVIMVVTMVLSFGLSLWLTATIQPWAFFTSPARAWEFAVGGFVALTSRSLEAAVPGARREWLAIAGIAGILLAGIGFSSQTVFPGSAVLLPVVGTAMVLAAGTGTLGNGVGSVLFPRPLQDIGDLSYVWYLWHWPVLVYAHALTQGELSPALTVVIGLGSLALASLTRRRLEDPIRFSGYLIARPALTLVLAAVTTVCSVGAYALWRRDVQIGAEQQGQREFAEARRDIPLTSSNGCFLGYSDVVSPECVFGATESSNTIVLFGDSHANHWFPALEAIAREHNWRIVTLSKSACPSADYTPYVRGLRRRYTECEAWRRASIDRVIKLRPSLVLLSNSIFHVSEEGQGVGEITPAEWSVALRHTLTEFSQSGLRSVVLHDVPAPGFDVPYCLARLAARPFTMWSKCEFVREDSTRVMVTLSERQAAEGLPLVRTLDLSSMICATSPCGVTRGDLVLYSDDHHLAARFSVSLKSGLYQSLSALKWNTTLSGVKREGRDLRGTRGRRVSI